MGCADSGGGGGWPVPRSVALVTGEAGIGKTAWCARSRPGRRRAASSAAATTCSPRGRSAPCATSRRDGPTGAAGRARRRLPRRRWRRCWPAARATRAPASRTCTGPTTPPSTRCATSPGGSTACTRLLVLTCRDDAAPGHPAAAGCSAPRCGRAGPCGSPLPRSVRRGDRRARRGGRAATPCSRAPAATRSSSPRCSRRRTRRCPPPSSDAVLARLHQLEPAARGRSNSSPWCPPRRPRARRRPARRAGRARRGGAARHRDVVDGALAVPARAGPPRGRAQPAADPPDRAQPGRRGGAARPRRPRPRAARAPRRAGGRPGHDRRLRPGRGREAAGRRLHRQALAHYAAVVRHAQRLGRAERARCSRSTRELYIAHRFATARAAADAVACAAQLPRRRPTGRRRAMRSPAARCALAAPLDGGRPRRRGAAVAEAVALLGPAARRLAVGAGVRRHLLGAIRALTGHPGPDLPDEARRTRSCAGRGSSPPPRPGGPARDLPQLRELRPPRLDDDAGSRCCTTASHRAGERLRRDRGARLQQPRQLCSACHRLDELERCVDDGLAFTRERGFSSHAYNLACTAPAGAAARPLTTAEAVLRPARRRRASPGCPTPLGVRQAAGPPAAARPADRALLAPLGHRARRRTAPSSRWRARRWSSGLAGRPRDG